MGAEISGANALWQLFQPDSITPAQFAARLARQRMREEVLMLAVLQDAYSTLRKHRHAPKINGQRLYRDEVMWFESRESDWLYSFESICMHFGWDPQAIRDGVRVAMGGWK